MATVDFLRKMIDQSNLYDRRIRELERRLKRVEKDNNPIALIEPGDIDELFGGRLINGCARNLIETNIPNGNFKNQGGLRNNLQTGTDHRCLVKLATPVNRIDFIRIGFESEATVDRTTEMTADLADAASTSGMTAKILLSFINQDYDPETVTFNSKPTTINEIEKNVIMVVSSAITISGTTQLRIIFDIARSIDIGFEVAKGKGLIYGLQFRLDGVTPPALTGGLLVGPTIEIDEIAGPTGGAPFVIGSKATFVGTIA